MTKTIVCGRCGFNNEVTKFIYDLHQHKKIKIRCKKCKQPVIPKSQLPPSIAQKDYIRGLGGDPSIIKTRGEVNDYIQILEKRKEHERNPKIRS